MRKSKHQEAGRAPQGALKRVIRIVVFRKERRKATSSNKLFGEPAFIVFCAKVLNILKTENPKALKTLMFDMGDQGPIPWRGLQNESWIKVTPK